MPVMYVPCFVGYYQLSVTLKVVFAYHYRAEEAEWCNAVVVGYMNGAATQRYSS